MNAEVWGWNGSSAGRGKQEDFMRTVVTSEQVRVSEKRFEMRYRAEIHFPNRPVIESPWYLKRSDANAWIDQEVGRLFFALEVR